MSILSLRALVCSRLATSLLLLAGAAGSASAQHVGWLGPSYAGADGEPTASKPESKLWWNDGVWWGCLWSASAQSFTIHRLRTQTQTWIDTGTALDPRPKSRADCLWDGSKLYVASHQFTAVTGGPGHVLELYRYSYDPNADVYSLDVGFPTFIGDARTETLVIDKDSTGTLWAVWIAGLRVWTAHTLGDDRDWSTPTVHPLNTSGLGDDDIASIVRFGSNVGVMWSDQVLDAFRFTFHRDGEPASAWSPLETVLAGPGIADDHISLRAAPGGRVYAALKTTTNEIRLAVRTTSGVWSGHLVAAAQDGWTRPIVVLDSEERVVHVFATSPVIQGTIYTKTSSMDAIAFAAGIGTPVIADASGPALNDPTSTKQSVRGDTGLVVLASHVGVQHYAHHHDTLGGPATRPPTAVFHADPQSLYDPATVQFLDASTGAPTAWSWSFGDGAMSTARHPRHTYALPGQYTVSLEVTNGLGRDTTTRSSLIAVVEPPTTLVLRPIADGHAREESPDTNYAGLPTLRVRESPDSDYQIFLKFFVPPGASQVVGAELRLACIIGNRDGGSVHVVGDDWSEPTLDWIRRPVITSAPLGNFGEVENGTLVAMDVGAGVTGNGTVSFGIQNDSFHSIHYSSRQGDAPPELHLTLQPTPPAPPLPDFEANRLGGAAPLTVQFSDTSSGLVGAWQWDFGDGGTSSLQNPSHVFMQPGRYTVSLTVTNSTGANTLTRPGSVLVLPTRDAGMSSVAGVPNATGLPTLNLPLLAGSAEAQGVAQRSEVELAGSLEDAFERCADELAESGCQVLGRSVRSEPSRASAVEVRFRHGSQTGTLLLRALSPERVAVELTLPVE